MGKRISHDKDKYQEEVPRREGLFVCGVKGRRAERGCLRDVLEDEH